jgi:hypothetical protein
MLNTRGMPFPIDVIPVCIRWYAAYPLSYRHLEEMMQERGVLVDQSLGDPVFTFSGKGLPKSKARDR